MDRKINQGAFRKRGRPAGKHRVPLSLEERRARNALYERERRVEMTEALNELAAAAGCSDALSNAELLATVITHLHRASQIKHSSDLDSLRRCNKNLEAQIANLEQRLAESDDRYPAPSAQQEAGDLPRPAKRKRDDYDPHEATGLTPLPECSPPEFKYTPPPKISPEQAYLPGPSRPPDVFLNQRPLPKYSPEPKCSPKPEYSSEPKYSPQSNCSPDPKYSPKPEYSRGHEQYYSAVPGHLPAYGSEPAGPCCPAPVMPQHFFPVPKVSPASCSSDPQSPDHSLVDYSSYHFAGPQVPTPEYQITAEPSAYMLPEPSYVHGQAYYGRQPLAPCESGPSSPEDQSSTSRHLVPEMQYEVSVNESLPAFPVQPGIVGSVEILPMPNNSILPNINGAELNPRQVNFLSTEDLISVYL